MRLKWLFWCLFYITRDAIENIIRLIVFETWREGNYRHQRNRFTGEHTSQKVHPMARLGVNFTEEQRQEINALVELGEIDIAGVQKIILEHLQQEFDD